MRAPEDPRIPVLKGGEYVNDTPNRPPLSPAAQAVLDAYIAEDRAGRLAVAAALRAAADQVVPELQEPDWGPCVDMHCDIELYTDHQRKRSALLAIAAELEGCQAEPPRRHVFPTPHQIAECGGPCEQGGPEACDCGLYERSSTKTTH